MDEQLEEIKIWVANFVGNEDTDYPTLRLDDYKYLIQQAGKTEELESDIKANKKSVDWLLYQNKRYKEALEDIKINSRSDVNRAIEKACKALEGEST
ncbi:hypothetical protein J18TS1_12300 [Oceanobacillus oncorhynchi subsp. incaldanensis]|uniref:hypothetical protein n=1 Tax=Oceanobacillus oncorhynchi TaxID=545501 RepID=UPI001B2F7FAC|nr:hypothetical protein [Oceanobacillus oncorhynchi]GIO18130.1 hypothetical protein J18TS1_12300 [Oceanobacillus oncorhynchi subsp. incaldanensis]